MASSTRRTVSRQPSKSLKNASTSVDQLASNFATKLAIGNPESKLSAMLSVNAASQDLSRVIQSGWKKLSSSSKTTLQSTTSSASAAVKHVALLRNLCPDDVDVERAAASILGKLVALEMFDLAMTVLTEMHPALCRLISIEIDPQGSQGALYLLSVPTPPSFPTNPVVLTLLSTYLLYALIIHARPESITIDDLAANLNSPSSTSFLAWVPSLTSLPSKHMDSLLTRVYTSLTKLVSSSHPNPNPNPKLKSTSVVDPSPESIFILRMYALRCLFHTSPGTVETNMVWDQVVRFTTTFVKATSSNATLEERCTTVVLSAYADLVECGEKRSDRDTFMAIDQKGKGFLGFCEYWMEFTKRTGDISALQKIHRLMRPSWPISANPQGSISEDSESPISHVSDLRKKILEASNFCNIFAQATVLLDDESRGNDEELIKAIQEGTKILNTPTTIVMFLQIPTQRSDERSRDEEEFLRIGRKVDRALEKLRRSALKCIESTQSSTSKAVNSAVRELLLQSVVCWRTCLTTAPLGTSGSIAKDGLTRALDTLFVLSRTDLNVQDPRTFVPAFECLSTAVAILDTVPVDSFLAEADNETVDMANYTRCVSGAFYNVAGSLYQATRYGAAVPFLQESCGLGGKALRLPRLVSKSANEKEWQQLEEQLFRRWELLALCYSKNGDRKNSYNALLQAIHTFPFFSSGLTTRSDTLAPDALFGQSATSAVKQLVSLVDQVSYLGVSELLLPTGEVSLKSALNCTITPGASHGTIPTIVDPRIIGALLERQLDSLEPSRWKESIHGVFVGLLRDTLDTYRVDDVDSSSGMPVRRARVLVRCMEFIYQDHGQDGWSAFGFANVDEMGCEIERLVTMSDLGKDTMLARYGAQYRTASRLWMALHAHRRVDPEQSVLMTQHVDEACRLIKELLASAGDSSPQAIRKLSSPKTLKKVSSPQVGKVSPKRTRTTRQRVPAAPKKAPPVKSRTALNPKTPHSRTRTVPQPASFNTIKTPPRRSMELPSIKSTSTLVFDNFNKLLELLQLTARILGFLMLILPKAHILGMARKLSQRQNGITSDGYVAVSIDLAHEYVALGKMRRGSSIFNQALEVVQGRHASPEVAVRFLLRYSESLAMAEEVPKSSTVYLEALEISRRLDLEQKGMSTQQRIHARARVLEMAAMASHTFAAIQFSKGDIVASLEGLLQSLRLWNRAADTLIRLNPASRSQTTTTDESDLFGMSNLKEALLSGGTSKDLQDKPTLTKNSNRRLTMDGLEWRISEGLLSTLFSLSRVYHLGGSAREAEYFAQQAADIAEELNLPAMVSRALAKKGEVQLQMGRLEDAHANLARAEELLCGMPGIDTADVRRLKADYQQRTMQQENVGQEFAGTVIMLEELDAAFRQFDNFAFGPRRSLVASPRNKGVPDVLAPDLLAAVLCRQLWLLRDDVGDAFNALLEKFLSLSYSTYNKAEETALMAKLTLHSIYGRFRADMFLSSLTESTIAVPMGMLSTGQSDSTPPSPDILDALVNAEKLLWSHLKLMAQRGSVVKVREAAISLALVGAFQTSLGNQRNGVPLVMASLLDASTALSLRRDMLVAIQHKISPRYSDDLEWPLLAEDGARLTASKSTIFRPALSLSDSEDDETSDDWLTRDNAVEAYWESVRTKYQSQILDFPTLSSPGTVGLPANWTIINISVTLDNGTLFISRQEGGSNPIDPLIFCVPLNGRRDHGNDDQQLSFQNAIDELQDIVHSSNESTKAAIRVKPDDGEARSNWWQQRRQLDVRMKELMENIEYCWLGAFKTILNPRPKLSKENIVELRGQFDKIFHRALYMKDTKPKPRPRSHKKSVSQAPSPSHVMLDDAMVECFSTLSPKCRDEELEDLVYFILDLYQFHGIPVAIAEVDIDQVVVDLRTALEENCTKRAKEKALVGSTEPSSTRSDEHLFLVLDKNVQGLPWESMPSLRGRSVSRIPGVDFLHDRVAFAKLKREARGQIHRSEDGAAVDACNGYYILNPSGDLGHTEDRFRDWSKDMRKMGWGGTVGRPVSDQEFVDALRTRDLVVYFGHGGGEQYIRSHRIRSLPTCAATMLWGCSSGALREMGDFDRTGTPYNYMLAGCPTLVANLWDVTDKDIDKFSQSVFDKLSLNGNSSMKEKRSDSNISIVAAVAQSRDSCKLKYLTGAAPVVYGIPFYL